LPCMRGCSGMRIFREAWERAEAGSRLGGRGGGVAPAAGSPAPLPVAGAALPETGAPLLERRRSSRDAEGLEPGGVGQAVSGLAADFHHAEAI
jgi:hypothetical protein